VNPLAAPSAPLTTLYTISARNTTRVALGCVEVHESGAYVRRVVRIDAGSCREHTVERTRRRGVVTRLLRRLEEGDQSATDELFALLYEELRELAHRQRRRWRGDHTLHTTALVHEAYLKLVGQEGVTVEGRAHFLAFAARAMRHVLCNHARSRSTAKRGGGAPMLPLDEGKGVPDPAGPRPEVASSLVALDDALQRLEDVHPRQSRVVECRFFGGLTVEETAEALSVSSRTVQRDWVMAQAWLHRELT
jgi:RNA polymerase sigma factor (TIGR02999 family)